MIIKALRCAVLIAGAMSASHALADMDLARTKNCLACHKMEPTASGRIGPSYKEVAEKYRSDKGAVAKLTKKVKEGGVGVWGQVPMPANPQVSDEEATKLVQWILSIK